MAVQKARPDGWLVFQSVEQFIRQQIPEEFANLEKRFGYKTIKEILLATEFFDIAEEPTKKGGVRLLYRIKPDLSFEKSYYITDEGVKWVRLKVMHINTGVN